MKQAALDVIDGQQLIDHQERFKDKKSLDINPIIHWKNKSNLNQNNFELERG